MKKLLIQNAEGFSRTFTLDGIDASITLYTSAGAIIEGGLWETFNNKFDDLTLKIASYLNEHPLPLEKNIEFDLYFESEKDQISMTIYLEREVEENGQKAEENALENWGTEFDAFINELPIGFSETKESSYTIELPDVSSDISDDSEAVNTDSEEPETVSDNSSEEE